MAGIGKSVSVNYTVTLTEQEFSVIKKLLEGLDLTTDEHYIQDELSVTFNSVVD